MARHAKFLGNGLAAIDFTGRVGKIHTSYKAGNQWERELFIESSSFAASAITGSLAVNAGLGLLLLASPAGWIGLIVGGVAIAGTAAAASMGMNHLVKGSAGEVYDLVMHELSLL